MPTAKPMVIFGFIALSLLVSAWFFWFFFLAAAPPPPPASETAAPPPAPNLEIPSSINSSGAEKEAENTGSSAKRDERFNLAQRPKSRAKTGLARAAPSPTYATVRVFFATDRKRTDSSVTSKIFGFDRAPIAYGTCDVSIPRDHRMGALESPSILKLEFREDPERHIVLLNVLVQGKQEYFAEVAARIKQSGQKKRFYFCPWI